MKNESRKRRFCSIYFSEVTGQLIKLSISNLKRKNKINYDRKSNQVP